MKEWFGAFAALCLVGMFAATPAQAGARLSNGQLEALFPGVMKGTAYNKHGKADAKFTAKLRPDGTVTASAGFFSDSGTWYVRGNRLCMKFRLISSGKLKCRLVEAVGPWYHALRMNGRLKYRFKVARPGEADARQEPAPQRRDAATIR